ncbi:MAG: hypothetical protein IAG10_12325 [Planctomycetaceae bacterium]|nr:hypothetical protein [Planctomycetaceae bacterium]
MSRWSFSISTTAGAVLFTIAAYTMIQEDRYALAGLCLLFAFCLPLYLETMRDKLLKCDSKMGSDGKSVHEPRDAQGADRIGH